MINPFKIFRKYVEQTDICSEADDIITEPEKDRAAPTKGCDLRGRYQPKIPIGGAVGPLLLLVSGRRPFLRVVFK